MNIRSIPFKIGLLVLAGGCESPQDYHEPISTPLPYYHGQKRKSLNIAYIRHTTLPQDTGKSSVKINYTPEQALEEWAHQRFKPDGSEGTLNIILRKKEFKESPPPQGSMLTRWTETDKVQLHSLIQIDLEFFDGNNELTDTFSAEASRQIGYEYTLSATELQAAWRKEVRELIDTLDEQLSPLIKPYEILEN